MNANSAARLRWMGPHALRVFVAIVFLAAGVSKLTATAETARVLADQAMPWPRTLGIGLGAFELAAGALLLSGILVRPLAIVLVAHVLFLAFVFHIPFGFLTSAAAHTQLVPLAFDLLMVAALYRVATSRIPPIKPLKRSSVGR